MGIFDVFKGTKKPAKKEEEILAEKRAALKLEAMANARAARDRMGDETIQHIAKKLQSEAAAKAARKALQEMDPGHIAGRLKTMLDDDR